MKQIKALQTLQASGKQIFSSADLQKLLGVAETNYMKVLAGRLVKEGVLERVMRGRYVLSSNKPSDFALANALYQPSYISLDSALNYYGILIQSPQQIMSVTTNATKRIKVKGKTCAYMHLDQKYFTDYQKIDGMLIASPEKALIDTIFFAALGRSVLAIEELQLQSIDKKKVKEIAAQISNKAFQKYFASISL